MNPERSVLILGEQSACTSALAERTRQLGFRTARAKTPQDAVLLAEERGFRFGVVLVQPDLPVVDLGQALDALRARCQSGDLTAVAAGPVPLGEEREQLRRAGVELALWEPVGDHALRFQLNRAMAGPRRGQRGDERIPTECSAGVFVAGRQKSATVYTLSRGGSFLDTRRPSQRGAQLALQLHLPEGDVRVAARVIYTNVPGNLQRGQLPFGMAVRFIEVTAASSIAIGDCIDRQAGQLTV